MAGKVLQPPSIASSANASRVPEVGGGPSTSMARSGSLSFTCFQVVYGLATGSALPLGSGIRFASAT
jgi:hypothetical protein